MTTPTNTRPTTAARLQEGVLVCIVLVVGVMAGAASFSHVHDWTMSNSPTGTGDWFGWANAVITELIPVAALIVITRRRKTGGPISYPLFLLVVSVGLSLTAQLAVAEPTVFGWMVSALPALAFFALSKLIFTATRPTNPVPAPTPAPAAPAPSDQDTAPATATPVADHDTGHPTHTETEPESTLDSREEVPPATAAPTLQPIDATGPAPATDTSGLLPGARIIADAHRKAHGEPITPGQLAVRLRVPTATAAGILTTLNPPTINNQPHNGTTVGASA